MITSAEIKAELDRLIEAQALDMSEEKNVYLAYDADRKAQALMGFRELGRPHRTQIAPGCYWRRKAPVCA